MLWVVLGGFARQDGSAIHGCGGRCASQDGKPPRSVVGPGLGRTVYLVALERPLKAFPSVIARGQDFPPGCQALVMAVALATVILRTLIAWAVLARRQIAQREEARKLAELEFAAMLAEQNWPTRELRDTIAKECNAVSRQKALAQHSAQNRNGRRRDAASGHGPRHRPPLSGRGAGVDLGHAFATFLGRPTCWARSLVEQEAMPPKRGG